MNANTAQRTVLIVDDEPSILGLAEATLVDEGHEILTAESGTEALEICAEQGDKLDVVIIDVVMPEMSGPELAEKIRQSLPEIPCIFTSGYGEAAGVALKQRDPNAHYLKKPFSPDALCEVVATVTG